MHYRLIPPNPRRPFLAPTLRAYRVRAIQSGPILSGAYSCGTASFLTSVVVSISGAPAAARGRIIARRRIVSRHRWIVPIRIVIRVIGVRVGEHRPKCECAEPDPGGGTRADPASTPTTRICGSRHRRQTDSSKYRSSSRQPSTSLPKKSATGHNTLLKSAQSVQAVESLQCVNERASLLIPYTLSGPVHIERLDFR